MPFESANLPTNLFIGGEWIEGSAGDRIDVLNPSDNAKLADVADATIEDGIAAVNAADAAAGAWKNTTARARSDILRRCYDLMLRDAESLARLISLENGKALIDARGEVSYAAEFFRWYAEEAVRNIGEISTAPVTGARIVVQNQPVGIALLVTPWNFPAAMATRKIGPALAAGCTCILKPATETPLTAYAVAALLEEAGVPKGVVNVITTTQTSKVVSAIMDDARVRKISFTGSTAVGRILLKKAAETVMKSSMELGGNAPFVVFDDADIDKALDGVMIAKMRNGGEACTAANRIYVQKGVHDEFAKRLTERMAALTVDDGVLESTQCGPLINADAVERVNGLVEDSVKRGAKVLTGGKPLERDGCFFPPTVLSNVSADAEMMNDEIFGPIVPIVSFDTEAEGIAAANDTEYGLVAYVYTKDLSRGMRVSEAIEAGMIALNRGLVSDPAAPFGGVKQSGLGREGAHHGMLEYMEQKYISVEW
ncbi:NAD-dependent succinate-semialdehyde dehydrogenase [Marinovum sp. 2_MG-2023]|uniref:NAD-dependent succinate-semialdehyde dehydrogenase n=1 Tax=unclassified Marinovum TaxID=2647166 RepID=UPI0026E2458F|nr:MULTISPECIES: NAD-dependent succinate-semialdehyde dehydrogenase [unclassified Marinovum]MDO6732395.1 NAD-dependent succinate-semialdehyde dehydrogenase [Marinovum sp. 2_MG-2023]MDO6781712.1 NAD-dependent succinate-semialdehyde dehydrogenase [Marinovum sp. 1_MG-2023]